MKINYQWMCAYCGAMQHRQMELDNPHARSFVAYCETEDGGCGKRNVIDFKIVPQTMAYRIVE